MWQDIEEVMKKAEKSLSEYKKLAKDYAINEQKYRVALSQRLLKRKAEGLPVTILHDVVKGEEDIAQLRLDRDISEALAKSAEKGTDFYKLYARLISGQVEREWGQAKIQ